MKKIENLCIVDDDNVFQLLIRIIAEKTELVQRIEIFSNGKEAIEFLNSVRNHASDIPEMILLDLNMPVMDGWEFLEEFALLKPKLDKKISIYIVSSSIDPTDIEKASNMKDVTDYVIKPVTREKLINLLNTL